MKVKAAIVYIILINIVCSCTSLREVKTANYMRFGCYRDTSGHSCDININLRFNVDHKGVFRFCAYNNDSVIQESEDSVYWYYKHKYIYVYHKDTCCVACASRPIISLPLKLRYTRKSLLIVVNGEPIVLHKLEKLINRGHERAYDKNKKRLGVDESIKTKYRKEFQAMYQYTSVDVIDSCRLNRHVKINNMINGVIWNWFHWKVNHYIERPML